MAGTETSYGLPERRAPAGKAAIFTLTAIDRVDHVGGSSYGPPGGAGTKMLGCADTGEDADLSVLFQPLSKFILYSIEDLSSPSPFLIFIELESPKAKELLICEEAFIDRGLRSVAVIGCRVLVAALDSAENFMKRAALEWPIKEGLWSLSVIWNTGRCGSTLMHKAILACGVASFSEPHWLDQLGFAKAEPALTTKALRLCWIFDMHLLKIIPPFTETTKFSISPKGNGLAALGKHFHNAFPSVHPCFMYRALDKVAESFESLEAMTCPTNIVAGKNKMWKEKGPGMVVGMMADKFKPIAGELPLASIEGFGVARRVAGWLNGLDAWRTMQGCNAEFAKAPVIRMDEFVTSDLSKRESFLKEMLVQMEIIQKSQEDLVTKALEVYNTNSQKNSAMGSSATAKQKFAFSPEQRRLLCECVAKAAPLIPGVIVEKSGANVIMPGSLGIPAASIKIAESKVKDMGLAEFGRKELTLAEHEMPGLMNCRKEFGAKKPFGGVRISGSLHMTIQTGVLIETLAELGAAVQWASCNIFSTQDHAAAGVAKACTAAIFAWKGETLPEYWWCTEQMLTWADYPGPDLIVDDGGDATLLIHKGKEFEEQFAKDKSLPDPESTTNPEFKCVLSLIRESIQLNAMKWTNMAANWKGVSEETTTGVHRLKEMAAKGTLLVPAINVNDCVTKSKFDNVYGCRHSLPDGIMRATDVMIGGKRMLICGFGDVGKGSAFAMRGCGGRVLISETDPICALQACMEGFQVATLEEVVGQVDIFVTTTGNFNIITLDLMKKMKNNAIVGNIGHFDNEIDMAGLEGMNGIKVENIKPQVDRFVFPDGHGIIVLASGRLLNLGCATGHPSFVMSCSFTNQTLAQLDLLRNWKEVKPEEKYKNDVYLLPKELDEKVARLHLPALGASLTTLSKEQADYIGVPVGGPYKPSTYRY